MKRLAPLIGTFVFILPATAFAQCKAVDTPIGHYTQRVIERSDRGIANAVNAASNPSVFREFDLHFLTEIQSIFYTLVDTDLRSVEYSRNLKEISTCLHIDLAIIEDQIERVRCEVNAAYLRKSQEGIRLLKEVAHFLNDRYEHLAKGGVDHDYEDGTWNVVQLFDPPENVWCCEPESLTCKSQDRKQCVDAGNTFYVTRNACLAESKCTVAEGGGEENPEDVCPFDSHYLAADASGYGCTADVIQNFAQGQGPIAKEVNAALQLENARKQAIANVSALQILTRGLDQFSQGTLLSEKQRTQLSRTAGQGNAQHVFGCNIDEIAARDNRPPPSNNWSAVAMRGPLSFGIHHIGIWRQFLRISLQREEKREFPDSFKNPDEFEDETERKNAMQKESRLLGLLQMPRNIARKAWQEFQKRQAAKTAIVIPKTHDAPLRSAAVFAPVRSAMRRNMVLVTQNDSPLRTFAQKYAYFVRRSCIFRPCNEKLDTILKTLFSDECFPYASGKFQPSEGTPEDESSWKKCQDAVNDK